MTTLVVDLSTKHAEVRASDGRAVFIWSNVTRRTAVERAHAAGWVRSGDWQHTSPPDGFWCPVQPCTTGGAS